MKRPVILSVASVAFLVTIALSANSLADSPLPPPAKQTIWSANKLFFAVMEPDKQITTVYRATEGKEEKAWSMFGWFRVANLADDGEHLIVGYEGVNLLPLNYDKHQVMIYFFKRGELVNHVTLDQIILDNSKLQRTVSHYTWGLIEGLDKEGRYALQTVEGRKLRFDVATGREVIEANRQSPSDKTALPRP